MKNLKLSFSLLMLFVLSGLQAQNLTQKCVPKGDNVTIVGFSHPSSSKQVGSYVQVGLKKWQEIQSSKTYNFVEENRDEWSVYLADESRNVYMQLDLHTKKIYYWGGFNCKKELYSVLNSSRKVNGRMAKVVDYSSNKKIGTFKQSKNGNWIETNPKGTKFTFTETGRDDWSIYLEDKTRGSAIQLDLHTMKVMLGKIGQPLKYQYKITGAE